MIFDGRGLELILLENRLSIRQTLNYVYIRQGRRTCQSPPALPYMLSWRSSGQLSLIQLLLQFGKLGLKHSHLTALDAFRLRA